MSAAKLRAATFRLDRGLMPEDREPQPDRDRFVCPSCEAFAAQRTSKDVVATGLPVAGGGTQSPILAGWQATLCDSCNEPAVWRDGAMIWPTRTLGPLPAADMPDNVRAIYSEARQVGNASPRSAAALLRLALEELTNELEPGSKSSTTKSATSSNAVWPPKCSR
jgi:ribosomal protein L37AE/L43A